MCAWSFGQGLLNLSSPNDIALFLVASILISLALVPITLLPSRPPLVPEQAPLAFRQLVILSPLGNLGAFISGLDLSALWVTGPAFDRQRVVWGKSVTVRVDIGGARILKPENIIFILNAHHTTTI